MVSNDVKLVHHDEEEAIKTLLLGRQIVQASGDTLTLDNGTVVKVIPNVGGCICGAGDYTLDELNKCEAVITSVKVDTESGGEYEDRKYTVFVLAADKEVMALSVSGNDGSGYYGTGYVLEVKFAEGGE